MSKLSTPVVFTSAANESLPKQLPLHLLVLMALLAGTSVWMLQVIWALPVLVLAWRHARTRFRGASVTVAFALGCFPSLGQDAALYFGTSTVVGLAGVLLWASIAWLGLWAVPFSVQRSPSTRVLRAMVVWVVVPALMFPIVVFHPAQTFAAALGIGMSGLVIGLVWCVWAASARVATMPLIGYVVVLLIAAASSTERAAQSVAALSTSVGEAAQQAQSRDQQVQTLALSAIEASAFFPHVVLPEALVRPADGSSQRFAKLVESSKATVWVGIVVPRLEGWENALARPGTDQMVSAWLPVPVASWRPWTRETARAFGPIPIVIPDTRILFCYESVSLAAWGRYLWAGPTNDVVFVSNLWWASQATQNSLRAAAKAFASAHRAAIDFAINR
jgi:hypothetical protein